jgi:Domain of unknown function (DUF4190)
VSDVSQGPGWWLASDGKWYSPEQVPGDPTQSPAQLGATVGPDPDPARSSAGPAPDYPPPGYPAPASLPPGYPAPASLPPGSPYGPPPAPGGYGYPGGGPGYGIAPKTNGLAIAAMICSFFFWVYAIPGIVAIVLGFIARGQIKRSNGTQTGSGMALTGIIVGFAGLVIGVVLIVVLVAVVNHCNHNGTCTITNSN